MATFVCLHGAGGRGSDWRWVIDALERRGHHGIGVDLPCDQEVGLDAYVDAVLPVIDGIDGSEDVVLLAQSLAGFIAPLVADRRPDRVRMLVLLAAMVPAPGERGHDWWTTPGRAEAYEAQGLPDDSPETVFLHDVPA